MLDQAATYASMPILDLLELPPQVCTKPKVLEVMSVVAGAYGYTVDDLRSINKKRTLVEVRQKAAALARELTGQSLPQIGRQLRRDHSTILHACRKMVAREQADHETAAEMAKLRKMIAARVADRPTPQLFAPPRPAKRRPRSPWTGKIPPVLSREFEAA